MGRRKVGPRSRLLLAGLSNRHRAANLDVSGSRGSRCFGSSALWVAHNQLHAVAAQDEHPVLRYLELRHGGRVDAVEVAAQHAADAAMTGRRRVSPRRRRASRPRAPSDPRSFRRPSAASGTVSLRSRRDACRVDVAAGRRRRCPASGRSAAPCRRSSMRVGAGVERPWRRARSPWSLARAASGLAT